MTITRIFAQEILASGGMPSLQVSVTLEDGSTGKASVPYGASAGSHEATVLLDNDPKRYMGNGMLKAVDNAKTLGQEIIGMEAENQQAIDDVLIAKDGTPNKATYGGNSVLALSMAVARAAASSKKQPLFKHLIEAFNTKTDLSDITKLPKPMVVAIEGGKHADDTTDLQEYCLTAINASDTPTEAIRKTLETYHHLKKVLKEQKLSTNVGNEGAFAPNGISSNEAPFGYMLSALEKSGYIAGKDISFSVDAAASEFYKDGKYILAVDNKSLTAPELIAYYEEWFKKYPIVTVEDMLQEDDWQHWPMLKKVCDKYQIKLVGDDLTVTNTERLTKAIKLDAISSILIKLNQIGSVSETVKVCLQAREHGLTSIPSHRGGGETNDTFMVDLAVAVGGTHIKVGPTRGERVSKYNRLMEIEALLS